MHAFLNTAIHAARDAAEAIAHSSDRLDRVRILEATDSTFTTNIDHDSEKTILYHIQKAYPEHSIQSRLSGYIKGEDENTLWLIDPLVGSRNFVNGFTHFCVSIACKVGDKINHAVVINPMQREEYTASRGAGAQLNSRRLRVSARESLEQAFVCLDPHAKPEQRAVLTDLQQQLLALNCHIRQTGASALDVVWVAAGKLDAGWLSNTRQETMAAVTLIMQESGGFISDISGNPDISNASELVFGNPKCFKQLLQLRTNL